MSPQLRSTAPGACRRMASALLPAGTMDHQPSLRRGLQELKTSGRQLYLTGHNAQSSAGAFNGRRLFFRVHHLHSYFAPDSPLLRPFTAHSHRSYRIVYHSPSADDSHCWQTHQALQKVQFYSMPYILQFLVTKWGLSYCPCKNCFAK